MSLLLIKDFYLSVGDCVVADGVDLAFDANTRWGVLGPNGSGKTTFIHTLAGLHRADAGDILMDGRELSRWSPRELALELGLLPQSTQERFPSRVLEVCLTGLHPHLSRWQWEGADDYTAVTDVLATVGLQGYEERWVQSLSGGEMQRLLCAVLILQNPRLWLLDEPTNHLDLKHQISLLDQISERLQQRQGLGIFVLHDLNIARRFCTHIILLDGRGGFESGPMDRMLSAERLSALYDVPMGLQTTEDGGKVFYLR